MAQLGTKSSAIGLAIAISLTSCGPVDVKPIPESDIPHMDVFTGDIQKIIGAAQVSFAPSSGNWVGCSTTKSVAYDPKLASVNSYVSVCGTEAMVSTANGLEYVVHALSAGQPSRPVDALMKIAIDRVGRATGFTAFQNGIYDTELAGVTEKYYIYPMPFKEGGYRQGEVVRLISGRMWMKDDSASGDIALYLSGQSLIDGRPVYVVKSDISTIYKSQLKGFVKISFYIEQASGLIVRSDAEAVFRLNDGPPIMAMVTSQNYRLR